MLARLGDELLLLGSTDGGITLLRAQPAAASAPPVIQPAPAAAPQAGLVDLATRLVRRKARPAPRAAEFDALRAESAEDQELRRKLARGLGGNVR